MRVSVGIDVRKLGDSGVGRYVESLLAGLARSSPSLALTVHGSADRWHLLGEVPAQTQRLTVCAGVYDPRQHLEFWRQLRQSPPAIFHAPHFTAPLILPRSTRLVVTIHDVAFMERPDLVPEERRGWQMAVYRLVLTLAAHQADLICVDTQAAARSIIQNLSCTTGKVRVLYPGLDVARLATTLNQGPTYQNTGFTAETRDALLFVGTITARKGVHELLRAFALTRLRRNAVRLFIVGQNTSIYAYQAMQLVEDLGIGGQVVFTGPLPDEKLLLCFRKARALVLPSFLEGFGFPVLEAMAAGLPCVASAIEPVQEIADEAALFVPPGDVAALADALDRVWFDHDLQRELGARGRERANNFTIERMGQATAALYQSVLEL